MTIRITRPEQGFKGYTNVFLIHGAAARAIRVVISGFFGSSTIVEDEDLALKAARYAALRGWKTIIVEPDCIDGHYAWAFNLDQQRTAYNHGYPPWSYHSLGLAGDPSYRSY